MLKKRLSMLIAMLLVVALFATACGPAAPDEPDAGDGAADVVDEVVEEDDDEDDEEVVELPELAGDVVTFAIGADATTLDVHRANDNPTATVARHIYDTLVVMDNEGTIHPSLAVSWEQIDELTWEFVLREDVYFHNGDHFTAADVEFNFERALGEGSEIIAPIVEMIDPAGTVAVDTYVVHVATEMPFAPLLSHLAHPASGIVNQRAVEEFGEDYGDNPVGTGPFMLYSWAPQQSIVLVRNDNFWGNMPAFEYLVTRVIPDDTARTIELQTGAVDVALDVAPLDIPRIEENPDLHFVGADGMGQTFMYMNNEIPGLDDVRVRQAITYAIDVELIVEVVWEGTRVFSDGIIPPDVWGAVPGINTRRQDVDRAIELMEEAGFADGLSLTITTNENPRRVDMATIMQQDLAAIGIDIEINVMEWGAMLEMLNLNDGEHELVILGWTTVTGDADYGLFPIYHTSMHGSGGNRSNFSHPRVDELLDQARVETDDAVRLAAYAEVQEILFEYAPSVFIDFTTWAVGVGNHVEGFEISVFGHHNFANIVLR